MDITPAAREQLTAIVGSEDYLSEGAPGCITIEGALADAILRQAEDQGPAGWTSQGGAVQVIRTKRLGIKGVGFTVIGPVVRSIVYAALRALEAPPALSNADFFSAGTQPASMRFS